MAKDIDIIKAKGTEQSVISSLTPPPVNMDVDQDVVLKAVFDVELDAKHVQKNNVKLKYITQTKESIIDGEVAYNANENAVTFKPSALLIYGYYEVEFKSLKAIKAEKSQQIKEIKYRFYVPEVINGYKLPPEPDETLNNSTLLGIDVNDNGVRDDVERWIYITYKDKHPIYIDIALQAARGYKIILEEAENAKEIHYEATAYIDCISYYENYAKYFNEKILIEDNFDLEYFRVKIYFNTQSRKDRYDQYDRLLSGDSYSLPKIKDLKSKCDFDTNKYEE